MTFKEEMINNFIPSVASMIEKEKKHLKFLKDSYDRINEKNVIFKRIYHLLSFKNIKTLEEMISFSQNMINHLESRYLEYTEYSNKLA